MRVLTTNSSLRGRSGTEIVTIDLALGLRRRGHEVAVFAPLLGRSAEILRDQGIIIADRPEDLPWKPDVVHGHHNHVLAAALAYFPDVPALFVCHSSIYWFDGPLLLPRVRRFCSVDEACRDRLIAEVGCEKEAIELLPNAVDLNYDVVFATARMALEALAVGCAVVVVDGRGLAGLATSSLVDEWRRNNFGLRLLTREPTKEAIVTEIGRYDTHDAALVSGRIREFASLSTYLDRVEAIYRDVVATPQVLADAPADLRALGRFIAQWLRRLGEGMIPENFDNLLAANKFASEHRAVLEENATLRAQNATLQAQLECLHTRVDALNRETVMLRDIIRSPLKLMRLYASVGRQRLFSGNR